MSLKVGAGKACINPTPEMFPFPKPLRSDWGIAPITESAVYDDMSCRAIAIEGDNERVLFVSWELAGVPHVDGLYEKIASAIGWKPEEIVFSGAHNHTGYHDSNDFKRYAETPEFLKWIEDAKKVELDGAINAAKQAVASMRPAKYGYGETLSYVNTNRDLKTNGGYWVEARNLAGFSDKTVSLIKFVDEEDKVIAALMNYGCHATCCYLMQDFDGVRKTSGNFNGIASRFVEEHFGNGAIAMWTSGAAGNQNPLLSHGLQYEYPDGWTSAVDYPDGVGYMHMELMGRTHGADCVRGLEEITKYSEHMPIHHLRRSIYLPAQKKEQTMEGNLPFRMGGRGIRDFNEIPFGQVPPVPEGYKMVDDPEHPVELKMQLITLGDIAVVGMNCELYAEIGKKVKDAVPFKKVIVLTHTENTKAGYILDQSAAAKKEKVFQAFSQVKPGSADDLIVQGAVDLFDDLLED